VRETARLATRYRLVPLDNRKDDAAGAAGFHPIRVKLTENSRRVRYYSLTCQGRQQLETELAQWRRTCRAVNQELEVTAP
jgi:hypothetical protein